MAAVLPAPLRTLFSHFPLHTYPQIPSPYQAQPIRTPTLWVHPPRSSSSSDVLSSDVECLKWQAYVALRFSQSVEPARVAVRWDVSLSGAMDGRLPNLHVPLASLPPSLIGKDKKVKDDGEGDVLPAHHIPEWVSGRLGEEPDELEGYKHVEARDESRAWVALLEGNVHAALVCKPSYMLLNSPNANDVFQIAFSPSNTSLLSMFSPDPSSSSFLSADGSLSISLNPPPAPLTGLLSVIPSYGHRVDLNAIEEKYRDAIKGLGDRLGEDSWMLGSAYVLLFSIHSPVINMILF